jgi:glutamate-ammonia-ligase adenylyltransferase
MPPSEGHSQPRSTLPFFEPLLSSSPDPEAALHFFERLRNEQPAAFERLTATPNGVHVLLAIFSYSRFLSEAVIARPDWVDPLLEPGALDRMFSAEDYSALLLETPDGMDLPLKLALFRRRQLLRILLRDVMDIARVAEIAEEISNLADAILQFAYGHIRAELVARYGEPAAAQFSIISLGKLGGKELNYSSDIDLLFLYSRNGETTGPERISNKEFFLKLANNLTDLLATYTQAGICYRVDLRLRPDGRLGEVVTSLEGARSYYEQRARDWELQMLIKARVSAGEREPGAELLQFVEPLIYSTTLDFSVVESASATRERIGEKLASRRSRGFNIKLAPGGIRDIEFLVQCLQRLHGGREKWVRNGGTLLALSRLRDKDLLSPTEFSRLASAYQFLRELEHRLQFYDDRQTHVLPPDDSLAVLARKMPPNRFPGGPSRESMLAELNRHLEEVQKIYDRVIHAQQPMYYTPMPAPAASPFEPEPEAMPEPAATNLVRYLDQRAPHLAAALAGRLRRGRVHFEHFLERIVNTDYLERLDSDRVLAGYVLDIFEHSPHFAEELIRDPVLLSELQAMRDDPGAKANYAALAATLEDAGELRRFFRRQMFRIQAESICLGAEIFSTLERTSDLADAVIAAAYRMAVAQTLSTRPPERAGYVPDDRMMVITMGRLGMREFDLASDADLVFVIPDEDRQEQIFWTQVAERMIAIITAYTGEGVIFAVDTRLRPNGSAGPLVQTEAAYKDYFAHTAQAWEGITYMKCRAVAGDIERGTRFLDELQQVDWRRYGQSRRSRRQLLEMRQRLEKEQGGGNRLKAGRGGYYDIDFAMMYLRLKSAGIFFKVLNTPERIDVVEKMGHLERPDADFLRDAATFYRALDHGLRVSTGHSEGDLPSGGAQLETLTSLVRRWTPEHLHDQPLPIELAQIQSRTREFFDRLFLQKGTA